MSTRLVVRHLAVHPSQLALQLSTGSPSGSSHPYPTHPSAAGWSADQHEGRPLVPLALPDWAAVAQPSPTVTVAVKPPTPLTAQLARLSEPEVHPLQL